MAAAFLVLTVTAAACGSDDADEVAVDTAADEAALGSPNRATGSPVKIGFANADGGTGANFPTITESAQAAVAYANDYLGGLDGHPVELVTCDDRTDGVSATECASRFIESGVVGVVHGAVADTQPYVTALGAAEIPWMAMGGQTPAEFTGERVFLWSAGILGQLGGIAQYATDHQFDNVAVVGINVPGVTAVMDGFATPIFSAAGIGLESTLIPPGTPDPTPQVTAALSDDPDAVIVYADAPTCRGVIPALAGGTTPSGTKPVVFITNVCVNNSVLETVPREDFEGVQLPAYIGPTGDDAETQTYQAVMRKYAPGVDVDDGDTSHGYVVTLAMVRALNSVGLDGDVTSDSLTTALREAKDVPLPLGVGATFTCDGTKIPAFRAMCSGQLVSATLVDAVPESFELIDATDLIAQSFPAS